MTAVHALWGSATAPIPGGAPQGADPSYDPGFLQLGKEVERGRSIDGAATDWGLVARDSSRLLRERAKDIRVASWLVVASARLHGWDGAATALQEYVAFLDQFWASGFPERVRTRAGFVAWLWQELARALEPEPVSAEVRRALETLVDLSRRLDATFDDLLKEANPGCRAFRDLVRDRLAGLPEMLQSAPTVAEVLIAEAPVATTPTSSSPEESAATLPLDAPAEPEEVLPHGRDADPSEEAAEEHVLDDVTADFDERSLDGRIARALSMGTARQRFVATAETAEFAVDSDDSEVALILCERLLPEVDRTLEAWEPAICVAFFETYIRALDATHLNEDGFELRAALFRRSLMLNPAKALRLKRNNRN